MKKLISLLLFLIFLLNNGCDKSVEPIPPKTSGEATINSNVVNFKTKGFSFSQAGLIDYPNSQNIKPDFLLLVHVTNEEPMAGIFLSPPDNQTSFRLIMQFENADSANKHFLALTEVPDTTYNLLALPLKEKQIWAIKTRENKHAKILILNTEAYMDSSNQNSPTPFGEATFKWEYQPNGSRVF